MLQKYTERIAYYIAVMGGSGIKKGAGTAASIHALSIFLVARFVGGVRTPYWSAFLLFYAIAWWATDRTLKASGEKDPSWITIDEWLAVWVMCLVLHDAHWGALSTAVALFRVFDIYKFGLTRLAEKLPGAWGVMVDDLMAAAHVILLFKIVPLYQFLQGLIFS